MDLGRCENGRRRLSNLMIIPYLSENAEEIILPSLLLRMRMHWTPGTLPKQLDSIEHFGSKLHDLHLSLLRSEHVPPSL